MTSGFDIYEMNGVPNDEVPDVVAQLQADPRYVAYSVIHEGGGTSTIIAVFRKADAAASKAAATVRAAKKVTTKKPTVAKKTGAKKAGKKKAGKKGAR